MPRALRPALLAAAAILAPAAQADDVVVFAAASLKTALDAVAADWTEATGNTATISYAASSALARQIEQGAPADIFFSADLDWMDYLQERVLVEPATRQSLLGNAIVLIAAGDDIPPITIAPGFDLAGALNGGRLAIADVQAVPAGRYGKAALESLGVWDSVADHLAQAENARAALALVSAGEAPLGIVYATDAAAEDKVTVVGTFPAESHPPIVYPVARTTASGNEAAASFLDFLATGAAHARFQAQGFSIVD